MSTAAQCRRQQPPMSASYTPRKGNARAERRIRLYMFLVPLMTQLSFKTATTTAIGSLVEEMLRPVLRRLRIFRHAKERPGLGRREGG